MLPLLQFSRGAAAAARSCRKYIPPKLGSCATSAPSSAGSTPTTLAQHHSSLRRWQRATSTGGLHPEPVVVPRVSGCGRAASAEVQHGCPPHQASKLPGLAVVFQRNISGSGLNWMSRFSKKDLSWPPLRRNARWGGFSGSRSIRHFGGGNYLDPQLALGALIAANCGVFFLWRSLGERFMESNFVVSAQALKEGRLHTVVTSIFSQYELHHLLSNMVGLYFFGSEIGSLFGGQKLILLYLTGGVAGALTHLAYWSYVKPFMEGNPRRLSQRSPGLLGSSGAVNAIILLDILLFPKRIIYMNLIIPVPAALVGVLIIGSDLWAATRGSGNGTSPAAHLGGAAVGALAWLRWR